MAFVLKRRVDLSLLSPDWKDCYIDFKAPGVAEIKDLRDKAGTVKDDEVLDEVGLPWMQSLFVAGRGFDGNTVVDIKTGDLPGLPIDIITLCLNTISGDKTDPKSSES